MKFGINLEGVSRAQSDCKLSNLLYPIGGWSTMDNRPVAPDQLTPPGDHTAIGSTPGVPGWTHAATVGYAPAGTYTVKADGKGRVGYNNTTFTFDGTPGQSFTTTLPGTGETNFYVYSTDPSNPLKKLRLIGPLGDDTSFFSPQYLESLRGFKRLRAMDPDIGVQNSYNPYDAPDWIAVSPQLGGGAIQYWSQADLRPGRGPRFSCELVTALAKVHGETPALWVNIPYRCVSFGPDRLPHPTDYPEMRGDYMRRHLPEGTEVYVEYMNEPWNYAFYDDWLVSQSTGSPGLTRYAYYGQFSGVAWDAFERGFGRPVTRVLNGQYVWPDGNLINALDFLKQKGTQAHGIASAPYYWIYPNTPATIDPIRAAWAAGDHAGALTLFFAALDAGAVDSQKFMPRWKAIAAQYGVRNIAYEGGLAVNPPFNKDPDMIALWQEARKDPRMAANVVKYNQLMETNVDEFNWFTISGNGTWGAQQNAGDCDSQVMTGLRTQLGLPPLKFGDPYPGDGFGSLGADLVVPDPPLPPLPATTASAEFIMQDVKTQGNWIGVYGARGASVTGFFDSVPKGVAVVLGHPYTWAATTTDPRAPQTPSGRTACQWYGMTSFTVELDLSDGAQNVSLYFLDWDGTARVTRVRIIDTASRAILAEKSVASFHDGLYLTWKIQGRVTIELANAAGVNATLSGLFLDPPPSTPTPAPIPAPPPAAPAGYWVDRGGGLAFYFTVAPDPATVQIKASLHDGTPVEGSTTVFIPPYATFVPKAGYPCGRAVILTATASSAGPNPVVMAPVSQTFIAAGIA